MTLNGHLGVRTTAEPPLMLRIGTWVWEEMKSRDLATRPGAHVVLKDDAMDPGSPQVAPDLQEETAGVRVDAHVSGWISRGKSRSSGVRRVRPGPAGTPSCQTPRHFVIAQPSAQGQPCPGPEE